MGKLEYIDTFMVPDYALSALVNGDVSGITAEDEQNIAEWLAREFPKHDCLTFEVAGEGAFCSAPAFGLPCACYEVSVYGHRKGALPSGNNTPGHYMGPNGTHRI